MYCNCIPFTVIQLDGILLYWFIKYVNSIYCQLNKLFSIIYNLPLVGQGNYTFL